jgi:hypothetical protein
MMKRCVFIAWICILLFLGSCANTPPTKRPLQRSSQNNASPFGWLANLRKIFPPNKTRPPTALPIQWAGTIRMVNVAEKFVLIESNPAVPALPGEKYVSVQGGRETGSLLLSSLKAPPFLIAEILSGEPSADDKIYMPGPAQPDDLVPPQNSSLDLAPDPSKIKN